MNGKRKDRMTGSKTVALAAAITFAAAFAAFAHGSATGVVKQRMDMMMSIASELKTVGQMMKGTVAFDAGAVRSAADAIRHHAERMPALFPEGSLQAPTEAHPVIWRQWETFVEIAGELAGQAEALRHAAGDATEPAHIRGHFAALGKTCSACHEDFRVSK